MIKHASHEYMQLPEPPPSVLVRLQAKVYCCFNLLGFGSFSYLPPVDSVVLTLIEK